MYSNDFEQQNIWSKCNFNTINYNINDDFLLLKNLM